MIKWNWGTGIFIVIVLFLGACAAFFIYANNIHWSLVEEDYYPKELRHEEVLVKMRNVQKLSEPVLITVSSRDLIIRFPSDFRGTALKGTLTMYRPSDDSKDRTMALNVDSSLSMVVPLAQFTRGKYVLKADWTSAQTGYFKEFDVFIP